MRGIEFDRVINMKAMIWRIGILIIVVGRATTLSQTCHTASYLKQVQSALMPSKGQVYFLSQYTGYRTETGDNLMPGGSFTDTQLNAAVFYCPYDLLDFGFSGMLLKNNHQTGDGWDAPSHIDLWATWGVRALADSSFFTAFRFSSRLPLELSSNVPMQHYAVQRVRFGVSALATWSLIEKSGVGVQLDINGGFLDHNDRDIGFDKDDRGEQKIRTSTKEFIYGLSLQNRINAVSWYLELHGRQFLQRPPVSAFTRENSLYINPGIMLKPVYWLNFNFSVDIMLHGKKDITDYDRVEDSRWAQMPNLPEWQLRAGLGIVLDGGCQNNRKDDLRDALGVSVSQGAAQDSVFNRERFLEKLRNENISEREFIESYHELLLQERKEREKILLELQRRLREKSNESE